MASLANRSIAEAVGTALLVYFGAGAAAITLMIAAGTKPATPFNIGIGQLGGLGGRRDLQQAADQLQLVRPVTVRQKSKRPHADKAARDDM